MLLWTRALLTSGNCPANHASSRVFPIPSGTVALNTRFPAPLTWAPTFEGINWWACPNALDVWVSVDTYPSGFNLFSVMTQLLADNSFNIDSTHDSPHRFCDYRLKKQKVKNCNPIFGQNWINIDVVWCDWINVNSVLIWIFRGLWWSALKQTSQNSHCLSKAQFKQLATWMIAEGIDQPLRLLVTCLTILWTNISKWKWPAFWSWVSGETCHHSGFNLLSVLTPHLANASFNIDSTHNPTFSVFQLRLETKY